MLATDPGSPVRSSASLRPLLVALADMFGTTVELLDREGRRLLSIDDSGEQSEQLRGTAYGCEAPLADVSEPMLLDSAEEQGARTLLLPVGPWVIAVSDVARRRREHRLLASIRESLPLIAKVVGGEGVIFDEGGVRLVNVDSSGAPTSASRNRISQYALQSMRDCCVVIGPSTSTPGAMAVRLPITRTFGLGFNNEQAVRQKIKLQEQINRDKAARYTFEDVIGSSASMLSVKALAAKASNTNSTVLLMGETGTGKEVFAQAIHNGSARRSKPFVAINCGAIPPTLIESTLFGYVKGAFTGADAEGSAGIFEQANGGTLSLDEVSEMDYSLQSKLLRVLEDREVTRIGSKKPIKVDVRIIASTNKELDRLVEEGKFRPDLLFRLDVVRVKIPPLREHREDILPIARFLLQQLNQTLGTYALHIEPRAAEALLAYAWPGNVRELRNCIELALNTAVGDTISLQDLPYRLRPAADVPALPRSEPLGEDAPLRAAIQQAERQHILRVLSSVDGNRQRAAEVLGISTVTLWRKLQEGGT